ncbi:hypothetical protein F5883DRAFT_518737 [Diaporthe sp. PMI_573]|nr:hypothetical protein F5883DRAFT_518737 [Diaporthaceae sp. PMI_573]
MGLTGSGKSTFISRLCGDGPKIGYGLESCTAEIEVFSFKRDDRTIHPIDTLGFNDTYRTDSDVLKDLVFWLNKSNEHQIRLSGRVYLHPIHEKRMTGASRKNMKIFRQLCGDSNLQSVVLATTMWKASTNESTRREFEERQENLRVNPEFWGEMAFHDSPVLRHNDNVDSALSIVQYILNQNRQTILQVQREMMEDGKQLDETLAGQELNRELLD